MFEKIEKLTENANQFQGKAIHKMPMKRKK